MLLSDETLLYGGIVPPLISIPLPF